MADGPDISTMSLCSIIAGSRPKLTESARESSSFPMGEYALSALAANPSKKSNNAAASISRKESSSLPEKAQSIPAIPLIRLSDVIELGIFLIMMFIMLSLSNGDGAGFHVRHHPHHYSCIRLFYIEFLLDVLRNGVLVDKEVHGLVFHEVL